MTFAPHFSQERYLLVAVEDGGGDAEGAADGAVETMLRGQDLQLVGDPASRGVSLCSGSHTLALTKVDTSNCLLLIPPVTTQARAGEAQSVAVVGKPGWVYESHARTTAPSVVQEALANAGMRALSIEELQTVAQCSAGELHSILNSVGALPTADGRYRMVPEPVAKEFFERLIDCIILNDMDVSAVGEDACTALLLADNEPVQNGTRTAPTAHPTGVKQEENQEQEQKQEQGADGDGIVTDAAGHVEDEGHIRAMIRHVCLRYGKNHTSTNGSTSSAEGDEEQPAGVWALDAAKVSAAVAQHVLRERGEHKPYSLAQFLLTWESRVPTGCTTAPKLLEQHGLGVVVEDAEHLGPLAREALASFNEESRDELRPPVLFPMALLHKLVSGSLQAQDCVHTLLRTKIQWRCNDLTDCVQAMLPETAGITRATIQLQAAMIANVLGGRGAARAGATGQSEEVEFLLRE